MMRGILSHSKPSMLSEQSIVGPVWQGNKTVLVGVLAIVPGLLLLLQLSLLQTLDQIPVFKKYADVRYSPFIITVSVWGPFVFANHYPVLCFGGKAITVATLDFGTWLCDANGSHGCREWKSPCSGSFRPASVPVCYGIRVKKINHEVFPTGALTYVTAWRFKNKVLNASYSTNSMKTFFTCYG